MTGELQRLLEEGVAAGFFPSAQAVVMRDGKVVFSGAAGGATAETVFDLASLTKVLCTTALFMELWGEGKVGPGTAGASTGSARTGFQWPGSLRFDDLLYHRSGLPAFIPFFAPVLLANPGLLEGNCPAELRARVRAEVVRLAASTPLERPPRERAVYSDVGFILLGEALAAEAGAPLDAAFATRIAQKLELGLHFRRLSAPSRMVPLASTGLTRPREPAPGQEGMWPKLPTVPARPGEVDDDNAWVMDGVAGHAGLFGTATDVARFGQAVLDDLEGARRLAPPELWRVAVRRDSETPGSIRALGFDTPSDHGSAAGSKLGKLPGGAVGHLGFTGTTLFIDLARHLVVALITNRTLLGRHEVRIRDFRPRFHDAAVDATGG